MLRRSGDLLRAGVCGRQVYSRRECVRLRVRFPGLSSLCRWFGPRVRASRLGIRRRRLESRRGWPAKEVRWTRRIDSPAPPGGLTLRAPASPASKTPPLPRCFSMSKGGSGGGGRLMRASQRPRRRRKNSTSDGKGLPGQAAVGGLEQSLHQSIRTATDGWGRGISFGIT